MDKRSGTALTFEYGVAMGYDTSDPHRSGMTAEEAETWMREWVQMTGRQSPFKLIRRPVGEWEVVQ